MSEWHVGLLAVAGTRRRQVCALGALALALALAFTPSASGAYVPPSGTFVAVDAGSDHFCAIRATGTLECWGVNLHGEAEEPAGRFTAVDASGRHTCGLKRDASIVCWGNISTRPPGSYATVSGSCGLRTDATIGCWGGEEPVPAGSFTSVSAGGHACAIRTDATLACWGDDGWGQATAPPGTFTSVSTGLVHSCAVRSDGTLACWGGEDYFEFELLGTPPPGSFTSVSAGHTHSCALRTDKTIACWGETSFGATTPPRGRFKSVSAGHVNTCAIRTNARLVCWGRDHGGAPLEAADAFSLPSCVNGRTLTIRVNRLRRVTFTGVIVKVRGKRVKTIRRHGFTGSVRLTGLPRRRFKLSVTAFAIGKPPVTATRTYRRCTSGAKPCGTVPIDHHEAGEWDGVVEVARGGLPCEEAMAIARTAAAEPFGIGDRLPAPDGWFCTASFRPTADTVPRYVLGCWQGDRIGPPPEGYSIGVRYPTG